MTSFPNYRQLDEMDCGPTCLRIISKYYGKKFSLKNLRAKCYTTRDGCSLLNLSNAAQLLGFKVVATKITWEGLKSETRLPCIVHIEQQHYAVVYKITKNYIHISDPAIGLVKYPVEKFCKLWIQFYFEQKYKGVVLILEPTAKFYKLSNDIVGKLNFSQLICYLKPYRNYLVQIALAMLIASILNLILPFTTQLVVDKGIEDMDIPFILIMLGAQMILVLGQMLNNLIRSWLMLHLTARINIRLISNFLFKLTRLPISFFDSKKMGDIIQRIGDFDRIQLFLTGTLISMVMAVITFSIFGVIMGGYDIVILSVFLFSSILYIVWVLLFMKKRKNLDHQRFQKMAANQSCIIQLITGMQDIKLNNCEQQKRWEWEDIQVQLFKITIKNLILGQSQEIGGVFY